MKVVVVKQGLIKLTKVSSFSVFWVASPEAIANRTRNEGF